MVGNQISAVSLRAVYARNAKDTSGRRTEWLPETNPDQGRRLLRETPRAVACGGASSIASFDSGGPAFLPRLKSQVSSEDGL
jgi:hypothetical protein